MMKILFLTAGLAAMLGACTPQTPATPTPPVINTAPIIPETQHPVLAKLDMASGDLKTLGATMEKLMGSWYSSPKNFNEEAKAWMAENNITDYYDTFSWGTNKAWIDFGDYRTVAGKPEKTGVGVISWHTGFKHLRFRESGARGGLVDGMIEIKDQNTFVRHYEFFTPKGDVKYRSDSWTFNPENPNCFMWQTTTYKGVEPTTHPAREYCKKQ